MLSRRTVLSHVNRLIARFRALSTTTADASPITLAALKKLKVLELREQLAAKGLSTTGLKAALVERLVVASNLSIQAEPESTNQSVVVATESETPKRRGRPRKAAVEEASAEDAAAESDMPVKTKAIHEDGMSLLSIEYPQSRRRRGKTASIDDALEQSDADFLESGAVDVTVGDEHAADESYENEPIKSRRRGKYTLDQLLKQEEAAEEALEVQMRARQAQRASARQQRSTADATSEVKAFEAQLSNVADRMKPKPLSDAVWARFPPSPRGQVGVHEVLKALEAQRAAAISIYDVSGRSPLTDITIICQGSSTNHIRAIADGVARAAREASLGRAPHGILDVQGRDSDDWMLVDLQQTAVMHVFTAEGRAQYAYVEDRAVVDSDQKLIPTTDVSNTVHAEVPDAETSNSQGSTNAVRFVHNCKTLSVADRVALRKHIDAAAAKFRAQGKVSLLNETSFAPRRNGQRVQRKAMATPTNATPKATDLNAKYKRLAPANEPLDDQEAAEKRRQQAMASMLKL